MQAKLLCPHVGCARRQDAQSGIRADQSAGHLPDGAISTDGKGRFVTLSRSLLAELDSVFSALSSDDIDFPVSLDEFRLDGFQERLDREAPRCRVVDDQRISHDGDYTALGMI